RPAETGDAEGRQGQPEACRYGAGHVDAPVGPAGQAGGMEGSLPHGGSRPRALNSANYRDPGTFPPTFPGDKGPMVDQRFILGNTALLAPPHVPEIVLHLADEAHGLWHRTEEELGEIGLPPPFWAFAWAGGQGLARYVLDNPQVVRGLRVLDFASGSGLVAIAAAKSG